MQATVAELAAMLGGAVEGDPGAVITGLAGLRQARPHTRRHHQAIDHYLDVVTDVACQPRRLRERHDLAVHASPGVALLDHVLEQVAIFTLLAAYDRTKHQELRPGWQLEDASDDLLARLGPDRFVAARAVLPPDSGEHDAQVVVNLRDCPDGAPRVPPAGLLLDRDSRAQPGDQIDVASKEVELAEFMERELLSWQRNLDDVQEASEVELSDEMIERLRSLGYIQ